MTRAPRDSQDIARVNSLIAISSSGADGWPDKASDEKDFVVASNRILQLRLLCPARHGDRASGTH